MAAGGSDDTTMTDSHGTTDDHGPSAHVPDAHGGAHEVVGPHGSAADHGGDGHGHDDHAHAAETLGPIDWRMWGVGMLGVAAGLAVTAAVVIATGFAFNA
jgi:hypothetical protein